MKRSLSLLLLAAGWLLSPATAQPLVGLAPGQSPPPPRGPSSGALPWLASVLNGAPAATGRANPRVVGAYGQLPLSFEANEGQTAAAVKFLARGNGYALFLTPTEAVLTLPQPKRAAEAGPLRPASAVEAPLGPPAPPTTARIKLVGANPHPTLEGVDELPGKVHYLRGNDPKQWRTNVPTYGKVRYAQAYPGIDLVYYGNPRRLEHDFVVAPGADPSVIGLEVEGAGKARLDARGDLVWATGAGEVRLEKPRIYREVGGRGRQEVAGGYVLGPGRRVGFEVRGYDARRPLVIDPVLVDSTYLGGSGSNAGYGIAVDSAGNAYVTGVTSSTDFPLAGHTLQANLHGIQNAFVAKLNAAGTALVYVTYLGGSYVDVGYGIAVDAAGNAYVTGETGSADFPLAGSPLQPSLHGDADAFVAKLDAEGSALVYSTYLGGNGFELGLGIAVDAAGNAYVTGTTGSTNFPGAASSRIQSSLHGPQNAFVAKLNAAGSALVYSTYLGGNGHGGDFGLGIAVDAVGNAYVTGRTTSTDFPGTTGSPIQSQLSGGDYDAFVAKLDTEGTALVYATYLGGSGYDEGHGIAVDAADNAYVTGSTASPDFPGAIGSPLQSSLHGGEDAFVAKIASALGEGALPIPPSQVAATASGLAYSRVSQTFNGLLTLTNLSAGAVSGPLQILFTGLPPGVTLVNAAGNPAGTPYLTVPAVASLPPGQSITISVQFKNPSNAPIHFTPAIYSGSF